LILYHKRTALLKEEQQSSVRVTYHQLEVRTQQWSFSLPGAGRAVRLIQVPVGWSVTGKFSVNDGLDPQPHALVRAHTSGMIKV